MRKLTILVLVLGLCASAEPSNTDKILQLSVNGQVVDFVFQTYPSPDFILDVMLADGYWTDAIEIGIEVTGPGRIYADPALEDPYYILCPCLSDPFNPPVIIFQPDGKYIYVMGVAMGQCYGKLVDHIIFHRDGPGDVIIQIRNEGYTTANGLEIDEDEMGSIVVRQIICQYPACWDCPTQCYGDSDCDGKVKTADFGCVKKSWWKCYPDPDYDPCCDFDRNGCVKTSDFMILKTDWFKTVPADCIPGDINHIYCP